MEDNKFSFKLVWGILMAMAYIGISYLVVFTPVLIRYNDTTNTSDNDHNFVVRIILGIVLFIYGIFRGYRIWRLNK